MRNEGTPLPLASLDDAQRCIVETAARYAVSSESIILSDAIGRVLAEDVIAPIDVPGFVNSAMDGFAIRCADLSDKESTVLQLGGVALAGGSAVAELPRGMCVRITTGAVMPVGSDSVVMKEHAVVATANDGITLVTVRSVALGENVRLAGEDYHRGDFALARGAVLTPARIGAIASFGHAHVHVRRKPRVFLLTTGNELRAPGELLAFGNIYDSNRYSLGGLIEQHGAELVGHERVRDDPELLTHALQRAAHTADVVISSGGVSAGEADYLPGVLAATGEVLLWKVRIKPGMPFLFGTVADALVFGLPGNPVSGVATFLNLVKPALEALTQVTAQTVNLRARLALSVRKTHARTEFLRATLSCDESGLLRVTPLRTQGSAMLRGVADANAFIRLPEAAREYPAGTIVDVQPLPGWI